jgi:hypothetical protein
LGLLYKLYGSDENQDILPSSCNSETMCYFQITTTRYADHAYVLLIYLGQLYVIPPSLINKTELQYAGKFQQNLEMRKRNTVNICTYIIHGR